MKLMAWKLLSDGLVTDVRSYIPTTDLVT